MLAVRVEATLTPAAFANNVERTEVALAVNELQSGCYTCHTTLNDTPVVASAAPITLIAHTTRPTYPAQPPTAQMPVAFSNTQVNTELTRLGQRILDLPAASDQRFEQATGEFLQIFEQAKSTSQQTIVPDILQRIDGMDDLLRTLENQALPDTLKETDQTSSPDQSFDVYQSPPGGTGTAGLAHVTAIGDIHVKEKAVVLDRTPRLRPQEVAFATRRHGPPSVVSTFSDSVCNGRLSSVAMQSPFILLAASVPQHT